MVEDLELAKCAARWATAEIKRVELAKRAGDDQFAEDSSVNTSAQLRVQVQGRHQVNNDVGEKDLRLLRNLTTCLQEAMRL